MLKHKIVFLYCIYLELKKIVISTPKDFIQEVKICSRLWTCRNVFQRNKLSCDNKQFSSLWISHWTGKWSISPSSNYKWWGAGLLPLWLKAVEDTSQPVSLWWLTSLLKSTPEIFFTSGCIYSCRRPGYMPFVLLHLIDCQKGPQSPLFPFSIKQLSSFIWLLLPWWSTNLVTDAVRSALQWSAYSPLVQLSLASLWSTGMNTNYYCMTDSIFRSPLNHGTLVGCWTKWWNV